MRLTSPVFLTWSLHDNLPTAFAVMDRLLDEARAGAVYLRQPAVANMIVEAIHYNANLLGHYQLHAFVVMPNHVHLLATPAVALLKGITARRANAMLAFGICRSSRKIRNYIEGNPVRAGLVEASDYRWSSAGWATGGPPADHTADHGIHSTGQNL